MSAKDRYVYMSGLKRGRSDIEIAEANTDDDGAHDGDEYDYGFEARPHGTEKLDKFITVLDYGIDLTVDFADRVRALGFLSESTDLIKQKGKNKNYKYTAYLITNGSQKIDREFNSEGSRKTDFWDGWSSSFHDAMWNGMNMISGYGDSPETAIANRDFLIQSLIPGDDSSIRRFKLRRLVREGD